MYFTFEKKDVELVNIITGIKIKKYRFNGIDKI